MVLGVERKTRKSWVVWAEDGKYPHVIIEILSPSTARVDKEDKKKLYQSTFRTPNYFWFDPESLELEGFYLVKGRYRKLKTNKQGHLWNAQLELFLGVHQGVLRFFTPDGALVPTPQEEAELERQQKESAEQRAGKLAAKLRELNVDLTIPPASDPWNVLIRHSSPTPEEIQETLPPSISVAGGDIIKVADPAIGGISFFNGFGTPFFGPSGNGSDGSNLTSLGGISGYRGPQGPLVGVFLDNSIPNSSPAPTTLDFTPSGLGTDFASLSPLLGQIFYIGDGLTSSNQFQEFIAPSGATRLFLGIPDGFNFVGSPGAYDDNDGSYRVQIGVNETPGESIPEPSSVVGLLALSAFATTTLLRKKAA